MHILHDYEIVIVMYDYSCWQILSLVCPLKYRVT